MEGLYRCRNTFLKVMLKPNSTISHHIMHQTICKTRSTNSHLNNSRLITTLAIKTKVITIFREDTTSLSSIINIKLLIRASRCSTTMVAIIKIHKCNITNSLSSLNNSKTWCTTSKMFSRTTTISISQGIAITVETRDRTTTIGRITTTKTIRVEATTNSSLMTIKNTSKNSRQDTTIFLDHSKIWHKHLVMFPRRWD